MRRLICGLFGHQYPAPEVQKLNAVIAGMSGRETDPEVCRRCGKEEPNDY